MTLLRVDSSIRTEGSVSREVADSLEEAWSRRHPGPVVRRDLGRDPLPAEAWAAAVTAGYTPEAARSPQQRAAVAFATGLADEVLAADAIVVAAPLYNFRRPAAPQDVDRPTDHRPAARSRHHAAGRAAARPGDRPRWRVRAGHPPRRLGSLHPVPAADLRRGVRRGRDGGRGRADAGLRRPRDGVAGTGGRSTPGASARARRRDGPRAGRAGGGRRLIRRPRRPGGGAGVVSERGVGFV